MKCTIKEQETCDVEKMTCKGCYYEKDKLIDDMRKFLLKTNMMCDFLEWRNKDE